jgi:hypothetical protein
MKILAIEIELPGAAPGSFKPHLKAEAARVWELHRSGVVREFYFDEGRRRAVLILECADAKEARAALATLPLVREKLIDFELLPLSPYTGLERLFGNMD